jgi:hypothetical protein
MSCHIMTPFSKNLHESSAVNQACVAVAPTEHVLPVVPDVWHWSSGGLEIRTMPV